LIGLDPDSLKAVSDVVRVPDFPSSIAAVSLAASKGVWVAHPASYAYDERGFPQRRGDALQRLDPGGARLAQSIRAGPDLTAVALGQGSIWVADLGD